MRIAACGATRVGATRLKRVPATRPFFASCGRAHALGACDVRHFRRIFRDPALVVRFLQRIVPDCIHWIEMEHHYVVMATVNTGWLVERDARGVALHDALEEAIAEAVAAARDEATQEDVVCRVTLVDERGDRVPLTRFGQVIGRGMLLKRIRRWTDPQDAAKSRLSANVESASLQA